MVDTGVDTGASPMGTGLSPLRDEADKSSSPKASIPSAWKTALRMRAKQRCRMAGIEIRPWPDEPYIDFNHRDGPVLRKLDGEMRWLTWRQRFAVWRGKETAWSLELRYFLESPAHKEKRLPCLNCDHFPYGNPPHAPWCPSAQKEG